MGVNTFLKNIEVPKPVIWKIMREERKMQGYILRDDFEQQSGCEYVNSVHSFTWGEQHGILLDLHSRVFACGRSLNGRLGLSETD